MTANIISFRSRQNLIKELEIEEFESINSLWKFWRSIFLIRVAYSKKLDEFYNTCLNYLRQTSLNGKKTNSEALTKYSSILFPRPLVKFRKNSY